MYQFFVNKTNLMQFCRYLLYPSQDTINT